MDAIKSILKTLSRGEPLEEAASTAFFDACFEASASPSQIGAGLMAMSLRGETVTELLAGALALRKRVTRFDAGPDLMDTCGTGGDGAHTYNISTTVAFVLAARGVRVAKHGGRASSSRSGSSDVLGALGVNLLTNANQNLEAIDSAGICFLFAPHHHTAMKNVAPVRAELGVRTIFNLLGPLSNPAKPDSQLLGVYDAKWLEPMVTVLREIGVTRAMTVHGFDGLDEITLGGETKACWLKEDKITTLTLSPEDFGLPKIAASAITGAGPVENAKALREVLHGQLGPYRDYVLANAAGALWCRGRVDSLKEGVNLAAAALDNGAALAKLEALVRITQNSEASDVHSC